MRTTLVAFLLAVLAIPVMAQQAPTPKAPGAQAPQKAEEDAKAKARIRVDGAAGGTAPVPPEARKAVGAGAGPHKRDHLPSPSKLPRDEPVEQK